MPLTHSSASAHSVLASPLSFDYIAGKMMAVRACEAGCRLIELPVSNTIILPDGEQAIDLLPIVPSQLQSLIDKPEYAARIRNVLIGGAAPSADSCDALLAAGYKAYISYGMTETCSHVLCRRCRPLAHIPRDAGHSVRHRR